MTSLGNPIPTYGGDTILRVPMRNTDDRQLITDVSNRVADIYQAGDAYQGADREAFVIRELKAFEERGVE